MEKAVPPPALPPTDESDLLGKVVGDFRVLRLIGKGGMGQVFLAEQLSLKRQVALKIMRPDLAANATALRRFQLEAEAIARINHANIVQVHAFGVANGMHFMALEYVEGKNLREYLSRKGSPELLIGLSILRQVAAALQRASELGVIHRDIKPENILLTRKGEAKVTDFGLSRCLAGAEQQAANLTQSGVTMGTPLYMSPEQVQGKETDPRTDIYSLGITAYHMFAGHPPFRGASAIEVAIQHVQNTPKPLSEIRPDLPAELCQMIHKMMARDPGQRYQTAGELLQALTRLRAGLSGLTGQPTQGISLSQISSLGAPANSVPMPTAPTLIMPRPTRRFGWAAAVLFSLGLAMAGGALLHWQRNHALTAAPVSTATEPSGDVTPVREPTRPDPRETALLEVIRKGPDPRSAEERRRYLDPLVQLGTLYIEQRRLDEADKYFKSLRERPDRAVQALGRIGQAVVLAYRDQAKQSVELFLEMEKRKPNRPDLPFDMKQMREHPEHFLMHFRPSVRRMAAEALDRDAINLAPQPLPDVLEKLRKLPPSMPRIPEK